LGGPVGQPIPDIASGAGAERKPKGDHGKQADVAVGRAPRATLCVDWL